MPLPFLLIGPGEAPPAISDLVTAIGAAITYMTTVRSETLTEFEAARATGENLDFWTSELAECDQCLAELNRALGLAERLALL